MKICVLNGSPKGADSVTMQYVKFLTLAYPAHTFVVENVSQRITALGSKEDEFKKVIASISNADIILFATPVYYMLVPSQYKRFIELVFSRNAAVDFSGKTTASLTTSIHFFDHTANEYIHAIADDLGMRWAGSFMAAMQDLTSEEHQENLVLFFDNILDIATRNPPLQRTYLPVRLPDFTYTPAGIPQPRETGDKTVVILSDAAAGSNLEKMTTRIASCFGKSASIVPLESVLMKGGCLGCCRCAFENRCIYDDEFCEFWKTEVLTADIIIFAFTIKDRYCSAAFKQLLDRTFFLGHIPQMQGKQIAILAQGPYGSCDTLRENLTVYASLNGGNFSGFVTDEDQVSYAIDLRIDALADRCIFLAKSGYIAPAGFPAVAGHKVFRDAIWSDMRPIFRADDLYYRAHGLYDFPQNNFRHRIETALLSLLMILPQARESAKKDMNKHMIAAFARVFSESRVLARRNAGKKP